MTEIKGLFAYCTGEGKYSLDLECTGPNCGYLTGFPGTTCTNTTGGVHCSSDTSCQSTNYTSEFSLNQLGGKVQRNEIINFLDYGKVMAIISDGSKKNASVSVTNATSTPSCTTNIQYETAAFATGTVRRATSSATALKPGRLGAVIALWIVISLLFGASTATVLPSEPGAKNVNMPRSKYVPIDAAPTAELEVTPRHFSMDPRAGDPFSIEEVFKAVYGNLGAYLGGKAPIPTQKHWLPSEKGLLLELQSFVCSQGMFYALNGALFGTPWIFVDTCAEIVGLAFAPTGPLMIVGVLTGQTLCAYLLNRMLDEFSPGFMTKTCDTVMEIARDWFDEEKAQQVFKPYVDADLRWYDLDNDPDNCGQVGKQCPTGSSCVGSACTSTTCSGASSAGSACGAQWSGCLCATDDTLTGYCVQDVQSCGADTIGSTSDSCQSTLECPGGYVCAKSEKCGRKLCLNAGSCLGSGGFDDPKYDTSSTSTFPPTVVPGSAPKSGWEMSFQSLDNYLANDFSLPEDWYLTYDNKRTVNTKCVATGELPFATIDSFPEKAALTWQTGILTQNRDPDSCCLALFEGTECNPDATDKRHKFLCNGVTSWNIPFTTQAWQVYNCTGLWTGQIQ